MGLLLVLFCFVFFPRREYFVLKDRILQSSWRDAKKKTQQNKAQKPKPILILVFIGHAFIYRQHFKPSKNLCCFVGRCS